MPSHTVNDIDLEIYNVNNNFHPGDIVKGSVTLNIKNRSEIEFISIQVIGISKAQWTRSSPTVPYIKVYKEKRKVLDIIIELYKKSNEDKDAVISDSYKFQFIFPSDLPPTFKSSIGKVFYNLKVLIKSKKILEKFLTLTVIRKVDLNCLEEFVRPTTYDLHHTFWNSKSVSITFKTYKGCSTGQKLPIKIMLLNKNNVKLKSLTVNLLQNLEYVVTAGYAKKQKRICSVKYQNILGKFVESCELELELPHIYASTIESINMVNVSYVLKFEAIFNYYRNVWNEYPITIGTVPIKYTQ